MRIIIIWANPVDVCGGGGFGVGPTALPIVHRGGRSPLALSQSKEAPSSSCHFGLLPCTWGTRSATPVACVGLT